MKKEKKSIQTTSESVKHPEVAFGVLFEKRNSLAIVSAERLPVPFSVELKRRILYLEKIFIGYEERRQMIVAKHAKVNEGGNLVIMQNTPEFLLYQKEWATILAEKVTMPFKKISLESITTQSILLSTAFLVEACKLDFMFINDLNEATDGEEI